MPAKRYSTGQPCSRGHVAERYVSTRNCVKCSDERAREWQRLNKRKYLDAQNGARRVKLFGLTPAQYARMLEAQGGGCGICGGLNTSGRALSVDHDHACCSGEKSCGKCVRGLLCENCNHGLGNFRDSPDRMRAAIRYLANGGLL